MPAGPDNLHVSLRYLSRVGLSCVSLGPARLRATSTVG